MGKRQRINNIAAEDVCTVEVPRAIFAGKAIAVLVGAIGGPVITAAIGIDHVLAVGVIQRGLPALAFQSELRLKRVVVVVPDKDILIDAADSLIRPKVGGRDRICIEAGIEIIYSRWYLSLRQ